MLPLKRHATLFQGRRCRQGHSQNLYDKSAKIPPFGETIDGNKDSWENW